MVRHLLAETVQGHPALELVGTASSKSFALAKIASIRPDSVLVDVDPPNLDAGELIAEIHERYPAIKIVVCSTDKARSARRQLFAAGASDIVKRPECVSCRTTFHAAVDDALLDAFLRGPEPQRPTLPPVPAERRSQYADYPEVCVIGTSTGGPNALSEVFRRLPRPEVPLIIVQHMPPVFTAQLAKRLSGESEIPFVEVEDGMRPDPRCGYIAPGDFHVVLGRDSSGLILRLSQAAAENSVRPSVDVLFSSAASSSGARVLGVVLTGMGIDGRRGSAAIRASGGRVVVQDQESSVVWGMPGSVVQAGLADAMIPLARMTHELRDRLPFACRTHAQPRSARPKTPPA